MKVESVVDKNRVLAMKCIKQLSNDIDPDQKMKIITKAVSRIPLRQNGELMWVKVQTLNYILR